MNAVYRIYVSARDATDAQRGNFDDVLEEHLPGWTTFHAEGVFQDVDSGFVYENTVVYEIVTNEPLVADGGIPLYITKIATAAKLIFEQDAILVTSTPVSFHMY